MLFIAHSGATAINANKIYFTKNPMAINYPQWIAFAKYSYLQLQWIIKEKPEMEDAFVLGNINGELTDIYAEINETWSDFSNDYIIVME